MTESLVPDPIESDQEIPVSALRSGEGGDLVCQKIEHLLRVVQGLALLGAAFQRRVLLGFA
jgi:hypothetical protein